MFGNLSQEIAKLTVIANSDVNKISWHNSVLVVCSNRGVNFFEYSGNLECMDKKLDFVQSTISISTDSPAKELFSCDFISKGLSNVEWNEFVFNPDMWAHNPHIIQEMVTIVSHKWSPLDIIYKDRSLLAVLNNIGNINIFVQQDTDWVHILNLSDCISKQLDIAAPLNFKELKEAVKTIETSAVCWAPKLNDDGSCHIVTVQKNGLILLWSLKWDGLTLKTYYQGHIHEDYGEIISIMWVNKSNDEFLLIISNISGQLIALECLIIESIQLLKTHFLWPSKDRMIVQDLHFKEIEDKIILFYSKHRHFLAQMIDKNCTVLSQTVNNVNDYRIIAITSCSDEFYIGTINCKIYKTEYTVIDNILEIQFHSIDTKLSYPSSELFGISFSENSLICALGINDKTICHRKANPKIQILLFSMDTRENSEISFLLTTPIRRVIKLSDCIELLRYRITKQKVLPAVDLQQLIDEGKNDNFKLKVYLIIATIWKSLEKNMKVPRNLLPVKSIDEVRDMITLSHAQSLIMNLYNIYLNSGNLTKNLEFETLGGAKSFIQFYCKKYEKNVNEIISSELLEFINMSNIDCNYVCQCCDEPLQGFWCQNEHLNMFCSLTFTLIEKEDYLVCRKCRTMARNELYSKAPMCLFCDQYML